MGGDGFAAAGQRSGHACWSTVLCDPTAELLPKARQNWGRVDRRFAHVAVHLTHDTHDDWRAFLNERGVPSEEGVRGWDLIGLNRRRSLELGLRRFNCPQYLYADLDHVLRWLERDPEELDGVLAQIGRWDCLVIGRSPAAFDAAPERLRSTEAIVNHIFHLMTGRAWDLMMAVRGLSRRAAEAIVAGSTVSTLGNDVEWPLLLARDGFTLGYAEADGLTYETNDVYAREVTDVLDTDPGAWMLRVYAASQHVEAMRPFLTKQQTRSW